ncbi:sensor histidine kinase [Edaphobacter albus]|uniref:sensor histidine kinase n=1 Tax=Edaphobacter sp. 4G125 TaxID=2763071 RepID=UPI002108429C|nr:ATP-binding protein [Edaphobacter sp. 4G125]
MSRLEMLDRMRSMGRSPEEGFAPARQDVDGKHRSVLEKMKDEFISTVSHELRTPLTSLRGALGLLSGGALETRPEKSRQMLEIAINNTDRLVKLVNDILDLQRISSGKSDLRRTDILAKELLRRAVEMEAIPQNRISLTADEIFVWADVDLIVQVLRNLLSNAIKFSPAESRIALCARSLNDQEIVFEIHDEGRGIPEDKLEHIFERFQQVDASDSRDLGGTGLGLAICRSIIHLHGGRIWATSTPGSETTFSFTLPISQN